jgi:hypothetical protein
MSATVCKDKNKDLAKNRLIQNSLAFYSFIKLEISTVLILRFCKTVQN